MDALPLPQLSEDNAELKKTIISLAEQILTTKNADVMADTSKEEAEIDRLVYQLYGLTEDEIKIVEGR